MVQVRKLKTRNHAAKDRREVFIYSKKVYLTLAGSVKG